MGGFNVVHDVLDAQVVDRHRQKVGRVDELLLELRENDPPRLSAVLMGSPVRAERIGHWIAVASRAWRSLVRMDAAAISRIPWEKVRVIAEEIQVDVKADDLPSLRGERRLRSALSRLPRAGHEEEQK